MRHNASRIGRDSRHVHSTEGVFVAACSIWSHAHTRIQPSAMQHQSRSQRVGALLIHLPAWVDQHIGGSRLTPTVHRCPKGMAVGGSSPQHKAPPKTPTFQSRTLLCAFLLSHLRGPMKHNFGASEHNFGVAKATMSRSNQTPRPARKKTYCVCDVVSIVRALCRCLVRDPTTPALISSRQFLGGGTLLTRMAHAMCQNPIPSKSRRTFHNATTATLTQALTPDRFECPEAPVSARRNQQTSSGALQFCCCNLRMSCGP